MKTTEITTNEIFAKGQVLTLAKAKEMVGRTIAITSPEYRANTPDVRIFTIAKFQPKWEWSAEQHYINDKFKTQQEYLKSYMSPEQIEQEKSELLLIDTEGKIRSRAEMNLDRSFYFEPTFTGSDADREVYYIEIGNYHIQHHTKGFYAGNGNWITRNWQNAKLYPTIEAAEKEAKTLKALDGKLLKKLQIISFYKKEENIHFPSFKLHKEIINEN